MPIYEFKCAKCKEEFECLVFRSDEAVSCPACDGKNVRRMMSARSFKSSGGDVASAAASSSSACSGCAGGHCSTCH